MRVLIVNDDGYDARGIKSLADAVCSKGHEVCMVAPSHSKSGASQAMTFFKPQVLRKHHNASYPIYSFDGSPADCVKLALSVLYKDGFPDVILSGINSETNIGTEMYYSGTVGAALEGAVNGVKSLAFSLDNKITPDYEKFAAFVAENFEYFLGIATESTPINVNFNTLPNGTIEPRITFASDVIAYEDYYSFVKVDEDGNEVYMLKGEPHEELAPRGSDVALYFAGYTVITPIRHTKTDFARLKELSNSHKGVITNE